MKKTILSFVVTLFVSSLVFACASSYKGTAEMNAKWLAVNKEVTQMMADIQKKMADVKGIAPAKLAAVKADLTAATEDWNKALATAKAGKTADAVTAGTAVKDKLAKIKDALGITAPPAPAAPAKK
ncbi:MAG: hypothetical protein WC539_04055 [Nitrospirota bacterium]